jgi:excisionase family DNA binding protein
MSKPLSNNQLEELTTMPRTKLGEQVKSRQKSIFTLADIPHLPTTLTIEKAAEVAGIGYYSIRALIDEGKLTAIKAGETKHVLPTWTFIIQMNIFPEYMLEKVYMQQIAASKKVS